VAGVLGGPFIKEREAMDHFLDFAQDYFDMGMQVVPITQRKGACFDNGWQKLPYESFDKEYKDEKGLTKTFKNKGIGLLCGEKSGVVCIDIDTKDKALQNEIMKRLPPLFSGKQGHTEKGKNYFFKYNGEPNLRLPGIDIISDKGMTVLPPTIHSSGKPYTWHGLPLLESLDDLPDLPKDFIPWVLKTFKDDTDAEDIIPSDGSRCGHNSHNKYSAIGKAMFHDGHNPQDIADRLIEYDKINNEKVSYFLCPSRRWKTRDIEINALSFAVDFFKGGELPSREVVTISEDIPQERIKFPKLRGVAQKMFEYIYAESHVPRSRLAMASVLSTFSILLANKIRLRGNYPNLYMMIVSPSGFGKDYPLRFPKHLLNITGNKHLIGQSNPSSDSGIIRDLEKQRERIDTIDEASMFFGSTNNYANAPYAAKMVELYTSLFTSTGQYFEGKTLASKKFGECYNPYISILAATTPKAFKATVTSSTIEKGLGARFLYFYDDEPKDLIFALDKVQTELDPEVIQFAKYWRGVLPHEADQDEIDVERKAPPRQIDISENAVEAMRGVHKEISKLRKSVDSDDKMLSIYNRVYQIFEKICIIDTVSTQFNDGNITWPKIRKDNVVWAWDFMQAYIKIMESFIIDNVSDDFLTDQTASKKVEELIKKEPKGLTKTSLSRKLYRRGLKQKQRNEAISYLLDSGIIFTLKHEGKTKPTTTYIHEKYVAGVLS
jgi:hypothetical protein